MFAKLLILFALVIFWGHPSLAQAQNQTGQSTIVTFAIGDGYAPFIDSALPEGGWHTALIMRVYASLGHSVQIERVPWKRALDLAGRGEVLGSFSYVPTPERQQAFLYSRPLSQVVRRIFVSPSADWQFDGLDSLIGRRACMELGSANPVEVATLIQNGKIALDQPHDMASCARMVARNRSDFFIFNEYAGLAAIRAANLTSNDIIMAPKPVSIATQHLLISRTLPDAQNQIDRFNAALASFETTADYQVLKGIYFDASGK